MCVPSSRAKQRLCFSIDYRFACLISCSCSSEYCVHLSWFNAVHLRKTERIDARIKLNDEETERRQLLTLDIKESIKHLFQATPAVRDLNKQARKERLAVVVSLGVAVTFHPRSLHKH